MVYMYIIQRSNKRNIIFYQSGAELDSDRGGSSGPGWTTDAGGPLAIGHD